MSRVPVNAAAVHNWKSALLRVVLRIMRVIPPPLAWWAGGVLGRTISHLPLRDVKRCGQHLALAFPEKNPGWVVRTRSKCFGHFGATALWTLATWTLPARSFRRDLIIEGAENLRELINASKAGQGTVVFSGHFGNWELLGRVFGDIVPTALIGRRLRDPGINALIQDLRTSGGSQVIYQDDDIRDIVRLLRDGTIVATLADQDIPHLAGCFVPWFGKAAWTPVAPAALALLARVPVQTLLLYRRAHRWVLYVGPRATFSRAGDRSQTQQLITAWATAHEEQLVRRQPEQYVWWHKRWRTRPPGETAAS
jgi:KDO2-lipid IV(A) lauroyltransferase